MAGNRSPIRGIGRTAGNGLLYRAGEVAGLHRADERRDPILQEGGIYLGRWLESTGTINAESLSRLIPSVSETTYLAFVDQQRVDGLFPYKLTENGPSFRQIQLVTPPARRVWNHYELHGRDISFLKTMYQAMSRYDDWIARYRNTRGPAAWKLSAPLIPGMICRPGSGMFRTRLIETMPPPSTRTPRFCLPGTGFDGQHLLSAHVFSPHSRRARRIWSRLRAKAEVSLNSLFRYCYDEEDQFFYDRDRNDELVRVQSDVPPRVMACEVGDAELFDNMSRRYLLNTGKFFAKYPFTSMAMDDPRFDPSSSYNSWGGPSTS